MTDRSVIIMIAYLHMDSAGLTQEETSNIKLNPNIEPEECTCV